MPFSITNATAEHEKELWGKQKVEAKVTRLWNNVDRKL
jgi:hypothetical protein